MSAALIVRRAGPGVTVQDLGRAGYLAYGISRGGAADRLALAEGAALLGQDISCAALEMVGAGGEFEATADIRIALTGAPMRASVDGTTVAWSASHRLTAGSRLSIGPVTSGTYGYLHVGGGLATPEFLGSRSTHLSAGLGATVSAGDHLPCGVDPNPDETGLVLDAEPRFDGGTVRIVPGPQTPLFEDTAIGAFEATTFARDARSSRMAVRLSGDCPQLSSEAGLSVLSEVIMPGDIQITGDGTPFVLMSECQTTGGYPRIGSVLPSDLPRVAQTPAGTRLQFSFVTLEEAVNIEAKARAHIAGLRSRLRPLIRDPHSIRDLLSYQLISGVTAGEDLSPTAV